MDRSQVINSIKSTATQVLPSGAKLLLFGSQARGDADAGSDWDLLVIVDKEKLSGTEEDDYTYSFYELGWTLGEEINPILYTDSQWQQRSHTPFYKNVMAEGIVLWQNWRTKKRLRWLSIASSVRETPISRLLTMLEWGIGTLSRTDYTIRFLMEGKQLSYLMASALNLVFLSANEAN